MWLRCSRLLDRWLTSHYRINLCHIHDSLLLLRRPLDLRLLLHRLVLTLLNWLRLRRSSLHWLNLLLLRRCRSVLGMLDLNMLLRRRLSLLLSYLSLLHFFRLHPNIHSQLLEPMFQRCRIIVLLKGLGRPIQRFLQSLRHLRKFFQPLGWRIRLSLLQQVHTTDDMKNVKRGSWVR